MGRRAFELWIQDLGLKAFGLRTLRLGIHGFTVHLVPEVPGVSPSVKPQY